MAQLGFDFHARPARPNKFGVVLALAGVMVLGWVWNTLQAARAAEAGLALQIAALEREEPRASTNPPARGGDTQARIAAQLAYSWQPAFDALAAARSNRIALLSLDAVQAKSQLKLVAEARQLADAVDFIDALQQQPGVKRAALFQHEVQDDVDQQPVRFNILVELGA
jgi:hypothetical protein